MKSLALALAVFTTTFSGFAEEATRSTRPVLPTTSAVTSPTFLEIGKSYIVRFANTEKLFAENWGTAKILQSGGACWYYVEFTGLHAHIGATEQRKETFRTWLNFAHVITAEEGKVTP